MLVGWGNLRVVTTGCHRVVTTLLAQGWVATVRLIAAVLMSAYAALIRRAGHGYAVGCRISLVNRLGLVGRNCALCLTSISSLSAAGFQEICPSRAPAFAGMGDAIAGINRADSANVELTR